MIATYEKTIYKDESWGFCICAYRTGDETVPVTARKAGSRDGHIHFTATGYLLPETSTVEVDLNGHWEKSRYGAQLAVDSYREILPATEAGILGYLSSGLIKGIGPKTARQLVDAFGLDTLQVLDKTPERLLGIKGIAAKKLERIVSTYQDAKALREIVSFLAPFGVSVRKCMQIREAYGGQAIQILKTSPYALCRIHGFGFKTVDEIARRMHVRPDDPQRIQGALLYTLEEAGHAGHLYLPREDLIRQAARLLKDGAPGNDIPDSHIAAQVYELAMQRALCVCGEAVYRRRLYEAEARTAELVAALARQPVCAYPNFDAVLAQSQKEQGLMLSTRQCEAVRCCLQQPFSILTGGPGTGKTTVLKVILDVYQKLEGGTILQAAPTGRAARRMMQSTGHPAGTLHSVLGLVAKGEGGAYHTKGLAPLTADFVVVDETSMMDIFLAEELFRRIRPGAKILLVGDADQLPSVGPGNVFRDLIRSGVLPVTRLDTVFRQSGASRIALNAQLIRQNRATLLEGPDFEFLPCADETEASAMIQRLYQDEIARAGIEQVQVLSPFASRGAVSVKSLNPVLRDLVNPARFCVQEWQIGDTLFREGDRIVQTRNQGEISNGDTGVLRAIQKGEDGERTALLDFGDGRTVEYDERDMAHIQLAYALTIHKSQGGEYAVVILPMLPSFYKLLSRNLVYTAITRAKKRVILVGQKKALYMAIHKDGSDQRNSMLANRLSALFSCKDDAANQPESHEMTTEQKEVS